MGIERVGGDLPGIPVLDADSDLDNGGVLPSGGSSARATALTSRRVRSFLVHSMFEQAFRNIDDALRKEAGWATELDYAEQTSWLLFLKHLDGLEQDKAAEAALEGESAEIREKIGRLL